jgi:hypothetical protein
MGPRGMPRPYFGRCWERGACAGDGYPSVTHVCWISIQHFAHAKPAAYPLRAAQVQHDDPALTLGRGALFQGESQGQ